MNTRLLAFAAPAVLAVGVVAAALTGAGQNTDPYTTFKTYELPRHRIFQLAESVVRLDTQTGEMCILLGGATAKQTTNQWSRRVPPVKGATSGMLDVQRLGGTTDGIFLTDVNNSSTWLLTWRGNKNGEWRAIAEPTR